jgi:hypothetical protein
VAELLSGGELLARERRRRWVVRAGKFAVTVESVGELPESMATSS